MKPLQLTDDMLAVGLKSLGLVSHRLAKIRGMRAEEHDTDAAEATGKEAEIKDAGEVRIIPIRGIIARDCRGWFPWATDTEELEELVSEAENDANVRAVIFDVDSPGGTVNGVVELCERIANMKKPTTGYASGVAASAGYWILSSCNQILIRRSTEVGCIGVYSVNLDLSKYYEQMGVTVEMFASGQYKGMGYPGTSLTDAQRSLVQSDVNGMSEVFSRHVETNRANAGKIVARESMQGQCFMGDDAVLFGLADMVVGSIDEAAEFA